MLKSRIPDILNFLHEATTRMFNVKGVDVFQSRGGGGEGINEQQFSISGFDFRAEVWGVKCLRYSQFVVQI